MRHNHWIFDLDGTLTIATHDFDSIRQAIGLPEGEPILEQLAKMSPEAARQYHQRLHDIEREHAAAAAPQPGVHGLLGALIARGARLGIVTRNTAEMALVTTRACGLDHLFQTQHVVGRETAAAKPSPDGLRYLMQLWGAPPQDTVMVGDYLFDLQAGRSAGCTTVAFTVAGRCEWPELADYQVSTLGTILTLPPAC